MDPSCEFKQWLLDEDGLQCKKPSCKIGMFECQWIDNCIPCPIRWQWAGFPGWGEITPETKARIINDASAIVTTLATNHEIEIPEVVTLFDLLDATRIVQAEIEGTEDTDQTLESIAQTLERLGELEDEESTEEESSEKQ